MVRHLEAHPAARGRGGHRQPPGAARRDPRPCLRYAGRSPGLRRIRAEGRQPLRSVDACDGDGRRRSRRSRRFFGVAARAEGGLVTHTLSTAVVGHDGRIMRLFPSNSWRPDDLFDVSGSASSAQRASVNAVSTAEASSWESGIGAGSSARQRIAAGSGLAGWNVFGSRGLLAQAPPAGVPDEILNPVEVSGAEARAGDGEASRAEAHVRAARTTPGSITASAAR